MYSRSGRWSIVASACVVASMVMGCSDSGRMTEGGPSAVTTQRAFPRNGVELRCRVEPFDLPGQASIQLELVNFRDSAIWLDVDSRPMFSWSERKGDALVLARGGLITDEFVEAYALVSWDYGKRASILPGESCHDSITLVDLKPGHYDLVGMFSYTLGFEGEHDMRPVALSFPPVSFDIE